MPLSPEKVSAIAKKQSESKKANEPPPAYTGLVEVLVTVAIAMVKLPWEIGTKKGQVAKNSPPNSPGARWRAGTKDLKTEAGVRAMSWNGEDLTWASISADGEMNALSLREAFESTNYYNQKWQRLMRDKDVIKSITFQTSDGKKITRAEAFALNDQVRGLPDAVVDPPPAAEEDTSLDA